MTIVKNSRGTDYKGYKPEKFLEIALPSDPMAERCLLGGVLLNNLLWELIENQPPALFYSPIHRRVFKGMKAAIKSGNTLNPIFIGEELAKTGELENIGGVATITNLTYGLPHFGTKDFKKYIRSLKKKMARREAVKLGNQLVAAALDESEEIEDTLSQTDTSISHIRGSLKDRYERPKRFYSLAELRPEFEQRITDYHYNNIVLVKTGIGPIDEQLEGGGCQPGAIYFMAAPPKAGKTALCLDIGEDVSRIQGWTTLGVSAEMNRMQVYTRQFSKFSGIPYWKFRPGIWQEEYQQTVLDLDEFVQAPFKISDNLYTFYDIREQALKEQDEAPVDNPVGLMIIDYAQLIKMDADFNPFAANRAREVSEIAKAFKGLATEMSIPIFLISSINNTAGKEGLFTMFDLKESGDLAYIAEVIWGLHNKSYNPATDDKRPDVEDIDLRFLANRGGSTDTVPLKFTGKMMSFQTVADWERINRAVTTESEPEKRPVISEDDLWTKIEATNEFTN